MMELMVTASSVAAEFLISRVQLGWNQVKMIFTVHGLHLIHNPQINLKQIRRSAWGQQRNTFYWMDYTLFFFLMPRHAVAVDDFTPIRLTFLFFYVEMATNIGWMNEQMKPMLTSYSYLGTYLSWVFTLYATLYATKEVFILLDYIYLRGKVNSYLEDQDLINF